MSQANSAQGSVLQVSKPAPGTTQSIPVPPPAEAGSAVVLNFDTGDGVSVSRGGNNLLFAFDDGSQIQLVDFFVTSGRDLPLFRMADGAEVPSATVLAALNSEMDLTTAAGPSRSGSGGAGDYADYAGSLLGGVDRLGMQSGIGQWSREREVLDDGGRTDPVQGPQGPPAGFTLNFNGDGSDLLSEASLASGTLKDGDLSRTISITAQTAGIDGGPYTLDTTGWTNNGDGTFSLGGSYGALTYDPAANTLTYTLTSAVRNDPDSDSQDEVFGNIVLRDSYGNTYGVSASVTILDDAPADDARTYFEADAASVNSGYAFHGAWGAEYGADGAAEELPRAITVNYTDADGNPASVSDTNGDGKLEIPGYGALTLNPDGTFDFQAKPNVEGKLEFEMTVTDADGDTLSRDFSVDVTRRTLPDGTELGSGKDEWFAESNLPGGTAADATQATKQIGIPDGWKIKTDGSGDWTDNGDGTFSLAGDNGHLTYNADTNRLTYTLETTATHGEPGTDTDLTAFDALGTVTLIDAGGNTVDLPVNIKIHDDVPQAAFGGAEEARSGVAYEGSWSAIYGADGAGSMVLTITDGDGNTATAAPTVSGLQDLGDFGSIEFHTDGTFTFIP
ncbi:MAG: hypothetical protein LBP61_02085, partial [Desulfovibrio sp.]|nr:hypothetical protein [Desulfovibrio sp.]